MAGCRCALWPASFAWSGRGDWRACTACPTFCPFACLVCMICVALLTQSRPVLRCSAYSCLLRRCPLFSSRRKTCSADIALAAAPAGLFYRALLIGNGLLRI